MNKNIFDKFSDSYEKIHLKESEIKLHNEVIYFSPKLKLIFAWSLFTLILFIAIIMGLKDDEIPHVSKEEKNAVLKEKVDSDEEHDTIMPYEKDVNSELNQFIVEYLNAITDCDYKKLQKMVSIPSQYKNDEDLKRKAEFITHYDDITVYSKEGLDEGSYIVFVVANVTIAGVNSKPYDILTLYVINGARGYIINNGKISDDARAYIDKVKGDKDIQKIYKSVEKKNKQLEEKDESLREFYEIISRKNVETNAQSDYITEEEETQQDQEESKKKKKKKKKKN